MGLILLVACLALLAGIFALGAKKLMEIRKQIMDLSTEASEPLPRSKKWAHSYIKVASPFVAAAFVFNAIACLVAIGYVAWRFATQA